MEKPIVEYEMKNFYCHTCQHKSLINIRETIRCPLCSSEFVEESKTANEEIKKKQKDTHLASQIPRQHRNERQRPSRPPVPIFDDFFNRHERSSHFAPFDMLSEGFNMFGMPFQDFSRRHSFLLNRFFEDFDFGFGDMRSFFSDPESMFMGMNLDDILQSLAARHPEAAQPAEERSIQRLKEVKITQEVIDKQEKCPVCQERFKIGEEVKRLNCDHHFHDDCIIPWLRVKNSCPLCRKPI